MPGRARLAAAVLARPYATSRAEPAQHNSRSAPWVLPEWAALHGTAAAVSLTNPMAARVSPAATGEPVRHATAQAPTVSASASPPSAQYRLAAAWTVPSPAAMANQVRAALGMSTRLFALGVRGMGVITHLTLISG